MDSGTTALRLRSSKGAIVEARRIQFGERFGPEGNRRHTGYEPRIEFVAVGRLGDRHLASYRDVDDVFASVRAGFAPGDAPGCELPLREAERLRAWLRDPYASTADSTLALLVGDEDELARVGLVLSRLHLDAVYERDARRALGQTLRSPFTLVVVGPGIEGGSSLGLVRGLRARSETATVPVLVLGGEAQAALDAGADAQVPLPLEPAALVETAAAILELV